MRHLSIYAILLCLGMFVSSAPAQQDPNDSAVASCTFADDHEISLRYNPAASKEEMPPNTPWGPGGSPMYLFTQSAVTIGKSDLGPGAYSVYLIGGKKPWTLIINKDVTIGAKYDESKDIVRVPMESGQLSVPVKQLKPSFVHAEPKLCNLRLYYGNTGAWAEFREK